MRGPLPYARPDGIPQLTLRLGALESVELLRDSEFGRYPEPMGFDPEKSVLSPRSDSGCDIQPDYDLPAANYVNLSPGVKVPWNYGLHGI